MTFGSGKSRFEIEYIESDIAQSVLWENHCHAQFEMIAVLKGDVNVIIEGRSCRLKEKNYIIIPPLCYHSVNSNGNGAYHRVTVLFDIEAVPDVLQSAFTKKGSNVDISFSHLVERLRDICKNGDTVFYAPLVKSIMTELFYDTVLRAESNSCDQGKNDFLQEAVSYIDGHLHEKILLDELARLTSRSKSSFCHLFEEKMNISPKQYILQKKMAFASKLIGEGVPPTFAAMQAGYDNYSDFYRIYVKHFGASPTKCS